MKSIFKFLLPMAMMIAVTGYTFAAAHVTCQSDRIVPGDCRPAIFRVSTRLT